MVAAPGAGRRHVPPAGAQAQDAKRAMGLASATISTSSCESFAKARQSATSASLSNGPCSRPVAVSITVQAGSQSGMPLKCAEPW